MDARYNYLFRDHGTYYFRKIIPKHYRINFKSYQIRKSLKTKNLATAQKHAILLGRFVDTLLNNMGKNMLSENQIKDLTSEYCRILLEKHNDGYLDRAINNIPIDKEFILTQYENGLSAMQSALAENDLIQAHSFIDWLKKEKDIIPDSKLEEVKLSREFIAHAIEAFKIAIERAKGNYNNSYDSIQLKKAANSTEQPSTIVQPNNHVKFKAVSQQPQSSENTTLGKLIEKFINENVSQDNWKPNTVIEYKGYLNTFSEVFGSNIQIANIDRKSILDYLNNVLKKLPKNRSKNKLIRDLPIEDQLKDTSVGKISTKTINKNIITLNSFFKWCIEIQEIISKNPCKEISLKDKTPKTEARKKYSEKDIKTIFIEMNTELISGKNLINNIDRKWIILLGAYQGLRENEICQLQIADIKRIKNIPCIKTDITEENETNQSFKTESSLRTIPIHPTLLKLGFLDFVNERKEAMQKALRSRKLNIKEKNKQKQLFQTMSFSSSGKRYSRNFLNFYTGKNGFNRKKITNDEKKTFHSFRHNFTSCISNRSEKPYVASCLNGHKIDAITFEVYSKPDISSMLEEIQHVYYECDVFEIFNKTPLTEEQISKQTLLLPEAEEE